MHAFASRPHYLDHLGVVWDALGAPEPVMVDRGLLGYAEETQRAATAVLRGRGACVVAGYTDLFRARRLGYGPFVMLQHGAGQSYHGDPRGAGNPSYAGGCDHDDVALFVVPGPDPERRWRERYPSTPVVCSGNLRPLPGRVGEPGKTVAVTFHWPCGLVPETRSAWREYRDALPGLTERWTVLGHWHPRWGDVLRRWYEEHGIEPVADIAEVARRADLLVADNTSAIFEWAATGRPVVVLNASRYRKRVAHGLRFWEASTVGVQVERTADLEAAVSMGLMDPRGLREERARCVGMVYGAGSARLAAEAIARM